MIFHQNYYKNIFRPLFCHFLPNSAILRPPIFSGHGQFFGASELFGRKFGHLATVHIKSTLANDFVFVLENQYLLNVDVDVALAPNAFHWLLLCKIQKCIPVRFDAARFP
jgi:hypothetical protein